MSFKLLLPKLVFLVFSAYVTADDAAVRTVVTGLDESGQSVIVKDGAPELMLVMSPGQYMGEAWRVDMLPATNQAGYQPKEYSLEPKGAGGISFRVSSLEPHREIRLGGKGENDVQGMHQTDTIDFITVISGEMYARMSGGQEALLKAGDTLVQRGTNHAWINRGDVPVVFSSVMLRPAINTLDQVEH